MTKELIEIQDKDLELGQGIFLKIERTSNDVDYGYGEFYRSASDEKLEFLEVVED